MSEQQVSNFMQSLTDEQKEDLAIICITYINFIKQGTLFEKEDVQGRMDLADKIVFAINYGKFEANYYSPDEQDVYGNIVME